MTSPSILSAATFTEFTTGDKTTVAWYRSSFHHTAYYPNYELTHCC